MSLKLVLDPHSENQLPREYVEVKDEVEFLRCVADDRPLFVQGERLCQWADEAARARGWGVSWRASPSQEVLRLCPSLTSEQAKSLLDRIGDVRSLKHPVSLLGLGISRWPELDPAGRSEAGQAWSWLSWRLDAELSIGEEVFALALAKTFIAEEGPALNAVYSVANRDQAWQMLKQWLRFDASDMDWPDCPIDKFPKRIVERLQRELGVRAVETRGHVFEHLLEFGAEPPVLKLAAAVLFDYYGSNPCHMQEHMLGALRPHLSFRDFAALQGILPAADPGPPPTTLPELFRWFTDLYLTYRLRNGSAQATERIKQLGREFGLWYLRAYSNARAGGAGAEYFSWSRTSELARRTESVNLLVVLDGLSYVDAQQTLALVLAETTRLSLDELEVLLAPLPTVTHFAKKALMTGVSPVQAFDEKEMGSIETKDLDVVLALNAATPGQLVIWSLLEPDTTYHKPMDIQALSYEVENRLRSVAQRLARIVQQVVDDRKLIVAITTDHGRLLSSSLRTHPAPAGMKAHGRAAWGAAKVDFDKEGVCIQGDIAFIHGERFGLPEPAAVILSDAAFLTSDGRTGTESFPHGGVFPEEVLIPWVQFTRDRGPLSIAVRLIGRGVAGTAARMTLRVTNASEVRIRVNQLHFTTLDARVDIEQSVRPYSEGCFDCTLPSWPQRKDLAAMEVFMIYSMPAGERRRHRVLPEFLVDEMYSRDAILDDLL